MKRLLKNAFVALLGILSLVYLANPALGVIFFWLVVGHVVIGF